MSLLPALTSFFKPVRECAGLALFRSGIITVSCFCFLVVLKFMFQVIVIDRRAEFHLPYREDAVMFGVYSYSTLRGFVNNLGLARHRPVWLPSIISPLFAYIVINFILYAILSLTWIYFPSIFPKAVYFVGEFSIPLSFSVTLILTNLALKANTKTVGSIIAYTVIVFMLQVVITIQLIIAITCLLINNIRNERYLKNGGSISVDQQLLTGILVGVIYPLLKYAVTFVNRKTFAFASPPVPQNRSEEIVTNTTLLTLSMGNNLLWDVTGYVLILRNPSNTIFYLTLAATCLYNVFDHIFKAYWTRRQTRANMQVQDDKADMGGPSTTPDIKNSFKSVKVHPVTSASLQHIPQSEKVSNNDVFSTAFNRSEGEQVAFETITKKTTATIKMLTVKTDGETQHRKGSTRQLVPRNISTTTMPDKLDESLRTDDPSLIVIAQSTTSSFQKEDVACSIRSLPIIVTSNAIPSLTQRADPTQQPHQFAESTSFSPPTSTFLPISPPIQYAFFRVGLLSANWSCYWVATSIILLFATLPEASTWSTTYYEVPAPVLFTRFVAGSVICIFFDAISLYMEAKLFSLDFAEGVKECRAASLSSGAYLHLLGYICSVVGPFIIADAYMNSSPTYIAGRKRW